MSQSTAVSKNHTFSRDEVYQATLNYFDGDTLATDVWINKYCLKTKDGEFLEKTPNDMHWRLAKEFARIESKYVNPLSVETLYNLLKNFRYIVPQGSPMAGIGNDHQVVSLSNCFVISNKADSYGGILLLDQELVHLMKRRGGVGLDISHIRPKGMSVKNAAISSTGVVPFMERFSNSCREVAQDGRRGALMLTIDCTHNDTEDFIDAKLELKKVTGANISVKITDKFMHAVESESPFVQQFPIDSENPIIKKEVSAKHLFNKLVHNAWKVAEPGILFWDNIIKESPADCYSDEGFETVCVNPCAELSISAYETCRLLVLNLFSYVENPFQEDAFFNFDLFGQHVVIAQRLMDDLVDLEIEKIEKILSKIESDPEEEHIKVIEIELWKRIQHSLVTGRRTGLGITAEGDMLAACGFRYGTGYATDFSEKVHKTLATQSFLSSVQLAKERGSFSVWNYEKEKNNPFLSRITESLDSYFVDEYKTYGRRNIACLTVSPTGSISLLTKTSSGIEPVFQVYYTRRRKINPNDKDAISNFVDESGDHWEEYNVIHPKFQLWASIKGYGDLTFQSKEKIDELIKLSPYYGATANEIDALEKVRMQGKIQKYVDHSISVTNNLPEDISEEFIGQLFMEAWKVGCKGITVYRDKSRSGVLVSSTQEENKINVFKENHAPKRPKSLPCDIMRFVNKGEKWIGFLGLLDNRPYEVFTGPSESVPIPPYITSGHIVKEKNGTGNLYNLVWVDKDGFTQEFKGLNRAFDREFWNIGRLISGILRHSMPIPNVILLIDKLELDGSEHISNWKSGIKRMFKKYVTEGTKVKGEVCTECHSTNIVYKEGCLICQDCGHSKCG